RCEHAPSSFRRRGREPFEETCACARQPRVRIMSSWSSLLEGRMRPEWAEEIADFEAQIGLRLQGRLDEKVFAETRLRRGVYGQRYDNGRRFDGYATRELDFADKPTKGPDTQWDAPGMQRIKLPFGGLTPEQLEVIADCAEEYSDSILHVTTRQDF